jgi:hypothetical protein
LGDALKGPLSYALNHDRGHERLRGRELVQGSQQLRLWSDVLHVWGCQARGCPQKNGVKVIKRSAMVTVAAVLALLTVAAPAMAGTDQFLGSYLPRKYAP